MLVEDDRSLQEIYSIRLVAEGYDIAKADDGEEALAKAVQEKPDLIIADVMMPKISGFDMLDILRSQPETQNIKVIMMTALSSDDQRRRGESLGAERYLVKSQVGIEDVVNTVHEVLGDKPNDNAKANIETLSNIPAAPASPAPSTPFPQPTPTATAPQPAPIPNTDTLAAVPTTPTTTIQPTNPAAGPAPMPQQILPNPGSITPPSPNGGIPQNFNQAPVAMPGAIPNAQTAMDSTAGATSVPATQSASEIPQAAMNTQLPKIPLPIPPVPPIPPIPPIQATTMGVTPTVMPAPQNNAIQITDRIQPNAQLSAAAQATDTYAHTASAEKKTEEKQSGGERVIQPIHDPRRDSLREQMEKQMEEILGNDANTEGPQTITTKSARNVTPTPMPSVAQSTTDASTTPVNVAQAQNNKLSPEIKQDSVEQVQNINLAPDTSSQQDLVRTKLATQSAEGTQQTTEATKPEEQAEAIAAAVQPEEQAAESVNTPLELEEEKIEPIRPGYISQLEDDLSEDVEDDIASRMANELKDDDITKNAQAIALANISSTDNSAESGNNESGKSVKEAVANAPTSPNINQGAKNEPIIPVAQAPIETLQPDADSTPTEVSDNIPH